MAVTWLLLRLVKPGQALSLLRLGLGHFCMVLVVFAVRIFFERWISRPTFQVKVSGP